MIKATLTVLGKKYTSEGETKLEALSKLKPDRVKTKGILLVEDGEIKRERVLSTVIMQRLFSLSPAMREIQLKQVSLLF